MLTSEEQTRIYTLVKKLGEPVTAGLLGVSGPTMVRSLTQLGLKPATTLAIRARLATISGDTLADIENAHVAAAEAQQQAAEQRKQQRKQDRERAKSRARFEKLAAQMGVVIT